MLMILSPSKTMAKHPTPPHTPQTMPLFVAQASQMMVTLCQYSKVELMELFKCSDAVAETTYKMIHQWHVNNHAQEGHPALYSYTGMVYMGLDVTTLTPETLPFAQEHVRVLSALYGMLRPLDTIQPYRLDMKTPLPLDEGQTLYSFWQTKITQTINEQVDDVVINLASAEYSKMLLKKQLNASILEMAFQEEKPNGKLQTVGVYAKKARGMMARFAIQNQIKHAEGLKAFNAEGYAYNPSASKTNKWVFSRPHPLN